MNKWENIFGFLLVNFVLLDVLSFCGNESLFLYDPKLLW